MIKLTQTVQKGGCAAKVAATELRQILSQVQFPPTIPGVIVDGSSFDDAAIFQISPELSLVQTLDFFTPIVDSPFLFGQIASANALSDVYAMGGTPKTAMAILAFPLTTLDKEVIVEVLQGASHTLTQAQTSLVGGHSIDDDTLKFGLSVTGHVHPSQVWSNARAQVGDILILTKPLGTGTVTAAIKRGELTEADAGEALQSMTLLNRTLDLISGDDIHAATDITGFGLLGHGLNLAKSSQKKLQFFADKIPYFDRVPQLLEKGFLTKAHRTNWDYVQNSIEINKLSDIQRLICVDPQTSGGLLLAVAPDKAQDVIQKLKSRFTTCVAIGQVHAADDKHLMIS